MADTKKPFNPNEHLSKVQKPNDYLQVKWRLVWFRDEHPHGKITTNMVHLDTEKQMAVFKATVEDSAGGVAEGYGSETVKDFKDYIEKAETKAIGRALASLGYGTQFAPELDEGERIVDAPVERKQAAQEAQTGAVKELIRKAQGRARKVAGVSDGASWNAFVASALGKAKSTDQLALDDISRVNGKLTELEREKQPA